MKNSETHLSSTVLRLLNGPSKAGVVIGLTGEWGTGKTYLWKKHIQPNLENKAIIEISAFGVDSTRTLQQRLVTQALTKRGERLLSKEMVAKAQKLAAPVLTSLKVIFQGADSYFGTNLVSQNIDLLQLVEKGSIVCIDDIERSSKNLGIEEILGSLRVLAEERSCKVLAILNSESLTGDRAETLAAFSEKVFDVLLLHEASIQGIFALRIEALPKDSLGYKLITKHSETVLTAFHRSGHTNIRTLNRIFDALRELAEVREVELTEDNVFLLCSFYISSAEGKFEGACFYNFSPVKFMISSIGLAKMSRKFHGSYATFRVASAFANNYLTVCESVANFIECQIIDTPDANGGDFEQILFLPSMHRRFSDLSIKERQEIHPRFLNIKQIINFLNKQ